MDTTQPNIKESKKLEKIVAIILVLIIAFAVIYLSIDSFWKNKSNTPNKIEYTRYYYFLLPENAYSFINTTTHNLTIVDMRSCKCKYNGGHLPNATWNVNPTSFYNTTDDLLIYDENGAESIEFCENLVNHTYGKIICLQGGIEAWKNEGYEVVL